VTTVIFNILRDPENQSLTHRHSEKVRRRPRLRWPSAPRSRIASPSMQQPSLQSGMRSRLTVLRSRRRAMLTAVSEDVPPKHPILSDVC
jgi:hypothetical protein